MSLQPSYLEQLIVPLSSEVAQECSTCIGGIGDIFSGEVVDHPGIDGAKSDLILLYGLLDGWDVLFQPEDLE